MNDKETMQMAMKLHEEDNVATAFTDGIQPGTAVEIRDKEGNREMLTVSEAVPRGHKIALRDIGRGEHIVKYGEVIGEASADIRKGEYVHLHNLASLRGRGDLES